MIIFHMELLFLLFFIQLLSHVQHFETPGNIDQQASLSMEFSMQEHWSGLPFHIESVK